MANIRKSFNFRNGVQVDNDNFVVNANGLVGIGTSVPSQYLLNVYGDSRVTGLTTSKNVYVTDGFEVVGVSTVGFLTASNINVGILTAASGIRIGNSALIQNIVGYAYTALVTDNGGVGLHTTSKLGINTTTSPTAADPSLVVIGNATFTGGIVTAASFVGNANANNLTQGTIPDARFPTNLPSIGGTSISSLNGTAITVGTVAAARVATLNQNTTGTAAGLTGTPNITVGVVTASDLNLSGNIHSTAGISSIGNITSGGFISAASTITTTDGHIGIGTSAPTQNLTIKDTGSNATLEIIAPNNRAQISIGNSVGLGNSSALIRFNNKRLEFINYDVGSIDTYIHEGTGTGTTGNFRWIYGPDNSVLMSLSHQGYLGINESTPTHPLHVNGISTFTENAYFDKNVTIDGTLNASINLTGVLDNDVNSTGVSTFSKIEFTTNITSVNGKLGIGTTAPIVNGLDCSNREALFQAVGIGTTDRRCSVDFADAGSNQAATRFMIPPKVSTSDRASLSAVAGALIYNTSTNKLQFYNGSGWETVTSS